MSSFMESNVHTVSAQITSILSVIVIIILILYHGIVTYKNQSNETSIIVKIITICILTACFFYNTINTLYYFHVITPFGPILASCKIQHAINGILYVTNKVLIHYSYFIRLQLSYKETIFEVNKYCLIILYILSTLYFLMYIYYYATVESTRYAWNDEYDFCYSTGGNMETTKAMIGSIIVILYEFIISIAALTLFLRPMCKLKIYDNKDRIKAVIIKIGILNGIMIISSLIFFVSSFVTNHASIWFLIDNVVNAVCIVLMMKMHHKIYRKICCIQLCDFEEKMKNEIQIVVSNRSIPGSLSSDTRSNIAIIT